MSDSSSNAKARLGSVVSALAPPEAAGDYLGSLRLNELSVDIYATDSVRLPRMTQLLDTSDANNAAHLYWLLQKLRFLKQDVFLFSPPGPYARLLALTYCRMMNTPFELVSLHRDVGESELKQGREIRAGGVLEYVDSAVVRAAKNGSILILDGKLVPSH